MNGTAILNRHDARMAALTATPVGGGPGPQAANLPGTFQSLKLTPKIINWSRIDTTLNLVDSHQNRNDAITHRQTINCGKNCLCCPHINEAEYIPSVSMNRRYLPIIPVDTALTCHTFSVVYVVTCKKCGVQYVGQTMRALKDRILEHRRSIIKDSLNSYLVSHFKLPDHTLEDFSVQIAEVVEDKKDLCNRELLWIKLLNTAYPYGLNDNIAGFGNVSEGADPLLKKGHPYFAMRYNAKFCTNNSAKNDVLVDSLTTRL